MALLEKAAGQGQACAMDALGDLHYGRKEFEQGVEWTTKAAEAGLPRAMFNLGLSLDTGQGVAAPDYPAAAVWYRRAADAAIGEAAQNLSTMYTFGRGVTRSKRRAMHWMRKAAENGRHEASMTLAAFMYMDMPYAREVGHVGEAAGVATPSGVREGHDVPPDVLTGVVYWLQKGCVTGQYYSSDTLDGYRRRALEGAMYCRNDRCEVVGQLKDFKVCPQCKIARYCGDACQKQDWTAGGHKGLCGKFEDQCTDVS